LSYNPRMPRLWIQIATLAAYLPSAALPVLAERSDAPGGSLDPAVLVVPFCLAFAAGFPFWGRVADRVAAERVIVLALGLMVVSGAMVALAPSESLLIVARALQGAAAAGVPPAAQAALARSRSEGEAGRALSPMMLAVAFAVLLGPAIAQLLGDAAGWTFTALVVSCLLPLLLAATAARAALSARGGELRRAARAASYANARGVYAGWIVSACVLAGHWTVLTRIAEVVGSDGLGHGHDWTGLAPLTGALGLPLVVLAARAGDRVGPRGPMVATLVAGALGFALAATASTLALFVVAAGVGLAVYWAYLPVVAMQVQRSAGEAARGRAAGGLYASMWCAAAGAGALASLAPSWRVVLVGAGLSWGIGAVVAARAFIGEPATARAEVAPAAATA
jgi:MFS transporter, YNFM family, putative membrane transport protein